MLPTNLLHGKRPIGTIAYTAKDQMLEPFTWAWGQLIACCAEYVAPEGYYVHLSHATGSGQILARNELVKTMQGNWLLQLDSDHVFDPDLVVRMLALFESHKLNVLAGLYHFKEPPHNPVLYQYKNGKYPAIVGWPKDDEIKLLPIDAAGAGLLLVRRSVFDLIRSEQKAEPFDPMPPFQYDDFNFFERCRVLGIKCWCAPQIEAQHLGIRGYGSEDYDQTLYEGSQVEMCEVRI